MRMTPFILAIFLAATLPAQRDDVNKLAVMKARGVTSMTVGRVRYDMVSASYPKLEEDELSLLRVARVVPEGWAVRVYSPIGALLMFGSFSDKELTIAQGTFTFYHTNGKVESTGQFQNGVKSGLWLRYNALGNTLSERVYEGRPSEKGAFNECHSSLSCPP